MILSIKDCKRLKTLFKNPSPTYIYPPLTPTHPLYFYISKALFCLYPWGRHRRQSAIIHVNEFAVNNL